MTHTFLPGGDLILVKTGEEKGYTHLEIKDKHLVLVADTFYEDLRRRAAGWCSCSKKDG